MARRNKPVIPQRLVEVTSRLNELESEIERLQKEYVDAEYIYHLYKTSALVRDACEEAAKTAPTFVSEAENLDILEEEYESLLSEGGRFARLVPPGQSFETNGWICKSTGGGQVYKFDTVNIHRRYKDLVIGGSPLVSVMPTVDKDVWLEAVRQKLIDENDANSLVEVIDKPRRKSFRKSKYGQESENDENDEAESGETLGAKSRKARRHIGSGRKREKV